MIVVVVVVVVVVGGGGGGVGEERLPSHGHRPIVVDGGPGAQNLVVE
jgi:hypothetical protein